MEKNKLPRAPERQKTERFPIETLGLYGLIILAFLQISCSNQLEQINEEQNQRLPALGQTQKLIHGTTSQKDEPKPTTSSEKRKEEPQKELNQGNQSDGKETSQPPMTQAATEMTDQPVIIISSRRLKTIADNALDIIVNQLNTEAGTSITHDQFKTVTQRFTDHLRDQNNQSLSALLQFSEQGAAPEPGMTLGGKDGINGKQYTLAPGEILYAAADFATFVIGDESNLFKSYNSSIPNSRYSRSRTIRHFLWINPTGQPTTIIIKQYPRESSTYVAVSTNEDAAPFTGINASWYTGELFRAGRQGGKLDLTVGNVATGEFRSTTIRLTDLLSVPNPQPSSSK